MPTQAPVDTPRNVAVDVLRGFVMFWIIGTDDLAKAFRAISNDGVWGFLGRQLSHPRWEGFVFYDLIFPTFIYVIGISLVFSLGKILKTEGKMSAYKRLARRFLLMYFLAFIYDNGFHEIFEEDVICGVMQRLALCYFFTGILYCNLQRRGFIIAFVLLVFGYYILLRFVPIPGATEISFLRNQNWTDYIGKTYSPYHNSDPEGYLSTLPAIGTCILGVLTAFFLQDKKSNLQQKVYYLLMAGMLMTAFGLLISLDFPIIKRLWSPSYVFVAGGLSAILLGCFMQVLDIWNYRAWAQPFIWLGSNALTIYMVTNIVEFNSLAQRFVGGPIAEAVRPYDGVLINVAAILLSLLLVRYMYNNKIFIRV